LIFKEDQELMWLLCSFQGPLRRLTHGTRASVSQNSTACNDLELGSIALLGRSGPVDISSHLVVSSHGAWSHEAIRPADERFRVGLI
jgi:hypothetical protein